MSKSFQGTRWRSFIKRIFEDKVTVSLEVAKEGDEYKIYGETIMTKTKT